MSTSAKIHCHNCGNHYYVYSDRVTKDQIIDCPNCDAKIEQKMWDLIVHAMLTLKDVNYHFRKYHEERGEDLFHVELEHKHVPLEKFKFYREEETP